MVEHVDDQVVAVQIVEHDHVEGAGRRAFLFVAAHPQTTVIGAAIGEAVNEPGIAVVGEHDGPVFGEQPLELVIGHAVRVVGMGLQTHEVDDVDHTDLEARHILTQDGGRGDGLESRHVAAAGEHHVGFAAPVASGSACLGSAQHTRAPGREESGSCPDPSTRQGESRDALSLGERAVGTRWQGTGKQPGCPDARSHRAARKAISIPE